MRFTVVKISFLDIIAFFNQIPMFVIVLRFDFYLDSFTESHLLSRMGGFASIDQVG